jgi:hypothetical protein
MIVLAIALISIQVIMALPLNKNDKDMQNDLDEPNAIDEIIEMECMDDDDDSF